MHMEHLNLDRLSVPVLRFGIVALFLWFGLSQILVPGDWVAWVPEWPTALTGLSPTTIVLFNGAFETIFGVALAAGFYTRLAALLLALHLFLVAFEIGYNDIGVRDFALAVATLALALSKPDRFTLDSRAALKNHPKESTVSLNGPLH